MHKKEQKQTAMTPAAPGETAAGPVTADQSKAAAAPPELALVEAEKVSLPKSEFEHLKAEAAKAREHWDRLLRVTADFDNFKKRTTRERQEAARYAYAPLLQKLIPVLDNFDMALAAADNSQPDAVASLKAGIAMIYQQMRKALAESGLQEIDALRKPFDHCWHEAVSEQPTTDVPEGHVVQQLRKGYKLHDRLLRPAGVVVAKGVQVAQSADMDGAAAVPASEKQN